jgi:type II restriction/modification system DNA methylase subunit YeeA
MRSDIFTHRQFLLENTLNMAIDIKEVRRRLTKFAVEYAHAGEEKQQAQDFQIAFYYCFGISGSKARFFEHRVKSSKKTNNYIDGYVPGKLITEMKSRGVSLDRAFSQVTDYVLHLEEDVPPYILTCDFARFRLYHTADGKEFECTLQELPQHAEAFMFLAGQETQFVEESLINRNAAYSIALLHEALIKSRFTGHDLEVFLTRLLFCLFADDTGIFGEKQMFIRLLQQSKPDGTDLKGMFQTLFEDILNVPETQRQTTTQGQAFDKFAYVNGDLFKERTRIPTFDGIMRDLLLKCAVDLDWSQISPAIFGAMFQGVLEDTSKDITSDKTATQKRTASRRELGAHYTSERNILRVIEPLFLDALRAEFELAKSKRDGKKTLEAFYRKLSTLTFLDPACGCGNFLVIAYRELRQLEHDVIEAIWGKGGLLSAKTQISVKVSQFYGIEIDEAAAHIARVALYITDEQMNQAASGRFGETRPTVPIAASPTIVCANALQTDWASVLPPAKCSYVLGNPPFVGSTYQTKAQKDDCAAAFAGISSAGLLDFVAAWYIKAADYMAKRSAIKTAFVSTNSITQGGQVATLWSAMQARGVHIHFAHRTFKWSNEGKGVAAVHCVIVGFGLLDVQTKFTVDYTDDLAGDGISNSATHINGYLIDGPSVFMDVRRTPICPVIEMVNGSKPTDGGNLLLDDAERKELLRHEPQAKKWLRKFLGAEEFLNNTSRWCLWLVGISPTELKAMPMVSARVNAVKAMRAASTDAQTQKDAATPTLFQKIRQPQSNYLLIPSVSSENRQFIPVGYLPPETIVSNLVYSLPNATLYDFGMLSSTMHNAWMRTTCGRLKSDYRYSNTIVYNNYPWPQKPSDKHRIAVEAAAQGVLDARAIHEKTSLGDMYSHMHPELVKAHAALDKAVDAAYDYKNGRDDAPRVKYLFEQYQKITSPITPAPEKKSKPAKTSKTVAVAA